MKRVLGPGAKCDCDGSCELCCCPEPKKDKPKGKLDFAAAQPVVSVDAKEEDQ